MELAAFDKITITKFNEHINARVIGIVPESDGHKTYVVQSLLKDFSASKNGSRIFKINSKEIENKRIKIERHVL
jgi:hypothetical protein